MDLGASHPSAPAAPAAPSSPKTRPFSRMRKKRTRSAPPKLPPSQPIFFSVRANPSHYLVSFDPGTRSSEQRAVSHLLEHSRRVVCLAGLPGVGKTVALRFVAHHAAIHALFREGVALLGLADSTTADSLIADLCELVGRIAGEKPRRDIETNLANTRSHMQAVDAVADALRDRRVLLLLDNVADSASLVVQLVLRLVHWATKMKTPADPTPRLAVLASTRSVPLAKRLAFDNVVHVGLLEPTGDTARSILCAHLGVPRREFDLTCGTVAKKDNPVLAVLRRCGGLPLALAVAGGAVKRLLIQSGSRATIWSHYSAYLHGNFEQFGEISRLFANLRSCVDDIRDWPIHIPVRHALARMSNLPNDSFVSSSVLHSLWGGPSRAGITAAIDALEGQCLVTKMTVKDREVGLKVPMVVLDYCKHEAKNITQGSTGVTCAEVVLSAPYTKRQVTQAAKVPTSNAAQPVSASNGVVQGGQKGKLLGVANAGVRKPAATATQMRKTT